MPTGQPAVISKNARQTALQGQIAVGGLYELSVCRLFKSSVPPTPNTVWADLVEADFAGYAASATLVWGDPWFDPGGRCHATAQSVQFNPADSVTPNVIYGYAITKGAAPITLLHTVLFTEPVPMGGPDDACIVQPEAIYPPQV